MRATLRAPTTALVVALLAASGCIGIPLSGSQDDDGASDHRENLGGVDEAGDDGGEGAGDEDGETGDDAREEDGEAGGPDDEEELFAGAEWRRRIEAALAPTDCPPPPPREYNDTYYRGPLADSHLHIPHISDSSPYGAPEPDNVHPILGLNVKMADIACDIEWEGTDKAISFFPVFPHIDWQSLEVVDRAIATYPDKFIPFIMAPAANDDPPTVEEGPLRGMLEVYPGLFEGYGEIGLYARSQGGRDLAPDDPILLRIYPVLREHNLTVYFHPGDGHAAALDRVLTENPDINFIVHGDQIAPAIDALMDAHQNVFFTVNDLYGDVWLLRSSVTKEEFHAHFADYEPLLEKDLADWKQLIEDHPDQFMWGTDRGGEALWTLDRDVGETLVDYGRAFIGRLDPAVQERFAHKNVERAMGPAPSTAGA